MKKLLLLSLLSFTLFGLGNVFSKAFSAHTTAKASSVSEWAKFKDLFH